ncbi:MAG: DUF4432 family protein [Clostridia bacterium]|nr:DUF4432 family protein [Clostridia bacterium]
MGYPLLSADAKLLTSCSYIEARSGRNNLSANERQGFAKPSEAFDEDCYYYKQKAIVDGKSFTALINEKLNLGVAVWVNPDELPMLTNWQKPASGEYIMGIEPSNCLVEGVKYQKKIGELEMIKV